MIKSPLREWEGAASSPDGHDPERKRRDVDGRARSRGRGGGRDEGGAGVEGFEG